MKLEEIIKKAKSKEITLEDLTKEELLKFDQYENNFMSNALIEAFDVTKEEVSRVRRKKKLNSILFEKYYRNYLILMDYCIETYGITKKTFAQMMHQILEINDSIDMHIQLRQAYNRLKKIDWENIDPKKEIEELEIDVEFRLEKYEKEFTYFKFIFGLMITELEEETSRHSKKEKYVPIKKTKPNKVSSNTTKYPRNKEISENALRLANYKCECNKEHETFIRKKNHLPYMEPHHLIPLEFQDYFEYSLDVESNIVSLCSNCHNEIHYGINNKELIKKLYEERKEDLKKCGIEIPLNKLYSLYEIDLKDEIEI